MDRLQGLQAAIRREAGDSHRRRAARRVGATSAPRRSTLALPNGQTLLADTTLVAAARARRP